MPQTRLNLRSEVFVTTAIVTALYVASFFVSFLVVWPAQKFLFGSEHGQGILLFLPHGVRVITAWLLGWRSVLYLMPGAVIAGLVYAPVNASSVEQLLMILASAVCGWLAFTVLNVLGLRTEAYSDRRLDWLFVIFAGILASLFNAIILELILGRDIVLQVFLWGDLLGTIVVFFLLLTVSRLAKKWGY